MTSIRLLRGASRQFALSGLLIGVVLLMGCASASGNGIDPNEEIYGSLSDEERSAYDVTIGECQVEIGLVMTEEESSVD